MKNLKLFAGIILIAMMSWSIRVNAQNSDSKSVPQNIITAFNIKYPKATVKSWKIESDKYIAKTTINGQKSFVRFDKTGNWINTMSNIHWTWKLPATVHQAYNKTQYRAWNVDFITKIDKPEGEFYRIITDDSNLQADWDHQAVFKKDKSLLFKADGTLDSVTDVTDGPIAYSIINR